MVDSYLRDTLAVLAAVEDGPRDATGVLSLQEERLRLAVLESEDLAVATDVELTLQLHDPLASVVIIFNQTPMSICDRRRRAKTSLFDRIAGHGKRNRAHLARVNSRAGEGVFVGSHLVAGVLLRRQAVVWWTVDWRWQKMRVVIRSISRIAAVCH